MSLASPPQSPTACASAQLRHDVLNTVYDVSRIQPLDGYRLLVARHKSINSGVFVLDGDFNEPMLKLARQEARIAGLRPNNLYVYGRTASVSTAGFCFVKLDEIGLPA